MVSFIFSNPVEGEEGAYDTILGINRWDMFEGNI